MTIKYQPKKLLKKMAPDAVVEKLVTKNFSLNKTTVNMLERASVLSKKEIETVALKVIKQYKKKYREEIKAGSSKRAATAEVLDNRRLMVQRIKDATVAEITARVRTNYRGQKYTWLPSTAVNPDKKHMRKYGKTYRLGRGEAPGERSGCQCGIELLVTESRLDLSED